MVKLAVVIGAVLLLIGTGCTAPPSAEAEVDATSFCAGRMGHAPGTAKYQSCVASQIGANETGAERQDRERQASLDRARAFVPVQVVTQPSIYVQPVPYIV